VTRPSESLAVKAEEQPISIHIHEYKGRNVKTSLLKPQFKLAGVLSGLAVAAASMTLATAAQAQMSGRSDGSMSMYAPGSGYIGFNAGRSHYGDRAFNLTGFVNDRSNNAYSIYGGSFFNNNFGLELGYNDFGRVNRFGGSTKASAVSLSLVGKLPVGQSFNLLGRVGGSYVRTDVSATSNPLSNIQAGRDNKFDLSYGIGAEYSFTPAWSAVLQYDEYNLRYAGGSRERLNTTTVGVRYHF
jgi:OmpA-OmpF porin, OOP family